MPYKNIHFVKIFLELFDDKRFIRECSDSQKLDYFLWIAMAGITANNADADADWFKRKFNLSKDIPEIDLNLLHLAETFKKMRVKGGKVKFANFSQFHNYIAKSEGNPKELPSVSQNRLDIDKTRSEKNKMAVFEDILKHPLWESIKTKYPDRDYRYQFNLMLDWWATHKRKKPQNITAFTNWLNNTKPDLSLQSARLSELSKVEDRKKQEELNKIPPPKKETMDKLRENISNFKKNGIKTI